MARKGPVDVVQRLAQSSSRGRQVAPSFKVSLFIVPPLELKDQLEQFHLRGFPRCRGAGQV